MEEERSQGLKNRYRLKDHPVLRLFEYYEKTKKSTCQKCKNEMAGKNPTALVL
jgi:hypothetical protein